MTNFLENIISGPRIILVTGHFGSGKTEFSVSLAFALAALRDEGVPGLSSLALCDLDLENPYFRSRELTEEMELSGIRVYSDPYHGRNGSELQTLDPAILAPVQNPDCRVILDTGGNNIGAMILNQFRKHFANDYRMLYVVNRNRPGNDTAQKVLDEIKSIEETTGLAMSGLISNSHFIRETTAGDVLDGLAFAEEVGKKCGLPVLCACCSRDIQSELPASVEVFPIGMYMRQSYLDRKV
ncbi:MAG: hypothetical protein Q4A32_09550 [Lachnospiraceae bacterium]|nr:hypothetical protein [Lachnospiraceae bacterium]